MSVPNSQTSQIAQPDRIGSATSIIVPHEQWLSGQRIIVGLIGLAAALLLIGVFLVAGVISRAQLATNGLPSGHFRVAQDIPTSFGVVAVEHTESIKGLSAQDLAGVTHGIQSLVLEDQVQVQVAVTLTNLTKQIINYSPDQFRIIAGSAAPAHAVAGNIEPGRLQPDANIDATLSFVVPRNGEQLWVEFRDPGSPDPILIDLGSVDQAPQGGSDDHQH